MSTRILVGSFPQDQFAGEVTAEFVAMLSEDHGEVLRQGDHGDEIQCFAVHHVRSPKPDTLVATGEVGREPGREPGREMTLRFSRPRADRATHAP